MLRFVVQKHDASRLHYDFRLEMDGVLRSWAVPKGPSLDPREKRLAVHVEDHPLDYIDFEGVIPEGGYGAGSVIVWDKGEWEPIGDPREGYARGALKFTLKGKRMRGGWMLARMGGKRGDKNWLLIKERDSVAKVGSGSDLVDRHPRSVVSKRTLATVAKARDRLWRSTGDSTDSAEPVKASFSSKAIAAARKAALPAKPAAQLATLSAAPPPGGDWLHEIKFDGYRMLARIDRGRVRMFSRNGKDWTKKFPRIAEALRALSVKSAIIDGEVVHLQPNGVSSFGALKSDLSTGETGHLVYYAFDLLHLDGAHLAPLPLELRKEALATLIPPGGGGAIRYSQHVVGRGPEFHAEACRRALEGVVSKRREAPYRPGRNDNWLKVKCQAREEFAIVGWTDPSGSRQGLGALLLGYYDPAGVLHYAGRVGTGFTAETLRDLHRQLKKRERDTAPSQEIAAEATRHTHWARPDLVAELSFTEWTEDGRLRHPSFLGLREDKIGKEVIIDRAAAAALQTGTHAAAAPAKSAAKAAAIAGVSMTHGDKILYPDGAITKFDLAQYYAGVAEKMLPHLRGRPLTLVRCPDGQKKHCFFQKHVGSGVPEALRRIEIFEKDVAATYLMADDAAGLMSLVQMGVLEIHIWGSTERHLERPDRVVFDLDPDEGLPWSRVSAGAIELRRLLEEIGLESVPLATGGKGLHVVVPLLPQQGWDEVKAFTKAIADELVRRHPSGYTSSMSKKNRHDKIFIDYLRNQRGATAIAPYSSRAKPGAPVSYPLSWKEVEQGIRSNQFDVTTLPARLISLRRDPWQGVDNLKQKLSAALRGMKAA